VKHPWWHRFFTSYLGPDIWHYPQVVRVSYCSRCKARFIE
jgi:hypothetical protein